VANIKKHTSNSRGNNLQAVILNKQLKQYLQHSLSCGIKRALSLFSNIMLTAVLRQPNERPYFCAQKIGLLKNNQVLFKVELDGFHSLW
jgi:hypothetical protein